MLKLLVCVVVNFGNGMVMLFVFIVKMIDLDSNLVRLEMGWMEIMGRLFVKGEKLIMNYMRLMFMYVF